jgi:hypothetical protein
VRLREALASRGVGTLGRNDGIAPLGGRGGFVVVVTQDRREGLFQAPAEVAGQHPQEHLGAHPVGQPMPDGPHLEFTVPRRMPAHIRAR